MNKNNLFQTFTLLLVFCFISCKPKQELSATKTVTTSINNLHMKTKFTVCIWAPKQHNKKAYDAVRDHVVSNFIEVPLEFTGWGHCEDSPNVNHDVKLVYPDAKGVEKNPHLLEMREQIKRDMPDDPYVFAAASKVGREANEGKWNMILPIKGYISRDLKSMADAKYVDTKTITSRLNMIKSVALHEFGHFLGFDHERESKDYLKDGFCDKENDDGKIWHITSDLYFSTKYRKDGFMNECFLEKIDFENGPMNFNEEDIAMLRRVYPTTQKLNIK